MSWLFSWFIHCADRAKICLAVKLMYLASFIFSRLFDKHSDLRRLVHGFFTLLSTVEFGREANCC